MALLECASAATKSKLSTTTLGPFLPSITFLPLFSFLTFEKTSPIKVLSANNSHPYFSNSMLRPVRNLKIRLSSTIFLWRCVMPRAFTYPLSSRIVIVCAQAGITIQYILLLGFTHLSLNLNNGRLVNKNGTFMRESLKTNWRVKYRLQLKTLSVVCKFV